MANNNPNLSLKDFVENLIKQKQFPEMSKEIHEQMKKDLLERVKNTINAKTIAKLPQNDLEEFSKLLDSNTSDEKVQQFVEEKLPDSHVFISEVLTEFRKTYLGLD